MMQNTHALVTTEQADNILKVTLNRLEKKNALTFQMYEALTEAFQYAQTQENIHVLFITGGADIFTAGNDLQDFLAGPLDYQSTPIARFISALIAFPKPLVAAVNGHAVGIGTTLLLHCDLVYLAENARLQLPFISLGTCPEAASSFLLPQLVGHLKASEWLLLGTPITAQEALNTGLANAVFPVESYQTQAYAMAKKLAQQPPGSVQLTKQLLKAHHLDHIKNLAHQEGELFIQRLSSTEAKQKIMAFFNKKPAAVAS